jgi:ribosomal protein S13
MIQNKLSQELTVKDNLKSIIGFGPDLSNKFCYKLGINPKTKLSALNSRKKEAFIRLLTELSQNTTEGSYRNK